MKIRVLSFNIAGLQYGWFEGRRDALIRGLEELQPDVVFLQETTVVPERHYDQTFDIMKGTGLTALAYTTYSNEKEYESPRLGGIGIISRFPFTFVQNRKLPAGTIDPYGARSAIGCQISIDAKEIFLATTHLSYRDEEKSLRKVQTEEFLKFISFYESERVIFGGDFNATPDEPAIDLLRSNYKDVVESGPTYKNKRIDYLFTTQNLKAIHGSIVMPANGVMWPSDHSGVMADIEIS